MFFPNDKGLTKGSEISQKPVRNRPNATSLSLPCLFPHPPIRTPTPTPIAISTTTTASATATASPAGTTVSFPDRFRTAQAYFASKFEIECVHAWILTPTTTTTPAATAPPLPLVHLGISALAFKSNCTRVKGQKRIRNQSETRQKPAKRNLSLSLSLASSLTLPSELFPDRFRTAQAYFASKFEIECVHAWILTPTTRFATTLSTTTTPAATAPPLPLVHLGISALAFKSN